MYYKNYLKDISVRVHLVQKEQDVRHRKLIFWKLFVRLGHFLGVFPPWG